jgi:hypothetical protein
MQQPQVASDVPQETTFPDITEVKTVTGEASCNQLLAEGWVLVVVVPLITVGEMAEGKPRDRQQRKQIEDTQRYVRRLVGYIVGRRRE